MKYIKNIYKTRNGPGILVTGRANASQERVLAELSDLVRNFYERRELKFMPQNSDMHPEGYLALVYDFGGTEMNFEPVRDADGYQIDQIIKQNGTEPIVKVAINPLPPEPLKAYENDWDFPHAPFNVTIEKLVAYFNSLAKNKTERKIESTKQRDDFLEYSRRLVQRY